MSRRRVQIDGTELRVRRQARGISIEAMAEHLGLEPHVYEGLEKGTRSLSARQASALILRMKSEAVTVAASAAEARIATGPAPAVVGASRPPMPEVKP